MTSQGFKSSTDSENIKEATTTKSSFDDIFEPEVVEEVDVKKEVARFQEMLNYFILIPIIIGTIISYEDFKKGRIKNVYILLLLLTGLTYQILTNGLSIEVLKKIIYAFIISFSFWWLGIWPAGDSKFFGSLFLFFDANLIANSSLMINFMINTFVPVFMFYTFSLLINSKLDILKESLKFSFNLYKIFFLLIIFLGVFWIIQIIIGMIGFELDFFMSIIIIFIIYEVFNSVSGPRTEILFTLASILRIIFDYKTVFNFNFLANILFSMLIFIFFRFFILYIGFKTFTKPIKIKDLEPGMILAENIYKDRNGYQKKSTLNMSFIEIIADKKFNFIHDIDYLKEEDVKRIKKLSETKKLNFNEILVNQKQHFAVFILIGFLITLLIKTNFLLYICSF